MINDEGGLYKQTIVMLHFPDLANKLKDWPLVGLFVLIYDTVHFTLFFSFEGAITPNIAESQWQSKIWGCSACNFHGIKCHESRVPMIKKVSFWRTYKSACCIIWNTKEVGEFTKQRSTIYSIGGEETNLKFQGF